MIISLELSDKAFETLEDLARWQDISVSEFVRRALLAKMEDAEDLRAVQESLRDNDEPVPWEEVKNSCP